MDRRDFFKAAALGFLAAATGKTPEELKAGDNHPLTSYVKDSSAIVTQTKDGILVDYAIPKGVLIADNHMPGLLFQALGMTVNESKQETRIVISRVIAPLPVGQIFYAKFGDLLKIESNTLTFGVIKTDNTPLWFKLDRCVITSIGLSATAGKESYDPNHEQRTMVSEIVEILSDRAAEVCEKPNLTIREITQEELKKANPNWPNVVDLHELIVDAWRHYHPTSK